MSQRVDLGRSRVLEFGPRADLAIRAQYRLFIQWKYAATHERAQGLLVASNQRYIVRDDTNAHTIDSPIEHVAIVSG